MQPYLILHIIFIGAFAMDTADHIMGIVGFIDITNNLCSHVSPFDYCFGVWYIELYYTAIYRECTAVKCPCGMEIDLTPHIIVTHQTYIYFIFQDDVASGNIS